MTRLVASAIFSASCSACLFICFEKWGLMEYLQMRRSKLAPLPVDCYFCMLFWLNLLFSAPLIYSQDIFYIALPFAATPISKAIYENCKTARR